MNQVYAKAIEVLSEGGVAVIPTDTIYGVVARALDSQAVERVYTVRERNTKKPCIVLISNIEEVRTFGVVLTDTDITALSKYWPGANSIIFEGISDLYEYLHKGGGSLAFRVPDTELLRGVLELTGPLIAPSANTEGLPPATTAEEAKKYFGDAIDYYLDGGIITAEPSHIYVYKKGVFTSLR